MGARVGVCVCSCARVPMPRIWSRGYGYPESYAWVDTWDTGIMMVSVVVVKSGK